MKTEGIESIPQQGLKVSTDSFARLKAFQGGGAYWDHQDIILESLGQFLPPVRQVEESGKRFGIFYNSIGGKEKLWKSRPVRGTCIPPQEINNLRTALEAFKQKADAPDAQPNAKEIIQQFRLPDISKDPDLYRLCGPWWNRKLLVLWGCERTPDSSLAPIAAAAKLPVDKAYGLKRAISLFALLLLLLSLLVSCFWGWPALKHWYAVKYNQSPSAALRLDSLDETNRIVLISDNGSHDPDGTITNWIIAWGDGTETNFMSPPQKTVHIYEAEHDYTISLSSIDNLGATSSPPAVTNISFSFIKRQKSFEQAQAEAKREANQITEAAKIDAARLKDEAQKQQDLADQKTQQAKADEEIAEKKMAEAELAQQKANDALVEAGRAKTNSPLDAQVPASTPAQQTQPEPAKANDSSPEPASTTPSPPDPAGKQATDLIRQQIEILKGSAGRLLSDGSVEVVLVVRDMAYPNASIDVIEWDIDGKAYGTGNAQFTTRLNVAEHLVRVKVRRNGIDSIAKAKVVVTGAQTQTTDPSFYVSPLH